MSRPTAHREPSGPTRAPAREASNGATRAPHLRPRPATPTLALTVEQAAAALSVSYDTFHEQIEPELRIVRLGRRKLIPVSELQRWLEDHAEGLP